MKNIISALRKYIEAHRILSALIGIALLYGGYWEYGRLAATGGGTSYITAAAQKGTIIVSISGTGQVSASNQVDVKPKVSGQALAVYAHAGQQVNAGAILAKLDTADAEKTIRDLQISLDSANLDMEKLLGSGNPEIPKIKAAAMDALAQTYDSGFNDVSNAYLDFPTIMSGLQNILYGNDRSLGGGNELNIDFFASVAGQYDETTASKYRADAAQKYTQARTEYTQAFNDYKSASRYSSTSTIEALINETYNTTKTIAESVKSSNNLIQFYVDKLTTVNLQPQALANTYLANLNAYTGTTNSHLLNLLGIQNAITSGKDAVDNTAFTIRSQQISLQQRQNALLDAKQGLADYSIRAPFDGLVAKVSLKPGDDASPSTVVATLITNQKLAQISLNEVDVAKVKTDQKVTVTFDAIPDLSIAGKVTEVDSIGAVSQGVVTYSVKIGFDTQDTRIKTGMSVSTAIITDIKQDVLLVPNSAVKTRGAAYYVDVLDQSPASPNNQGVASAIAPVEKTVTIGLSDDNSTEITSGLTEGENVVTRTVTGTPAAATQAPSILSSLGGRAATGGAAGGAARSFTRPAGN